MIAAPATEPASPSVPTPGVDVAWSSVPVPLTDLVGREAEVAEVGALLRREDVRLVTLTGPGGVGKTRLALAVADAVRDAFAGVAFVPLAAVRDPGLVLPTVAAALGVRETGERSVVAGLAAALRDHPVLLVLDNLEQVLAAAPRIAELLAACSGVKVLATSRAPLRLSGERDVHVLPLALPDPVADARGVLSFAELARNDAVRLFAERAQSAQLDFALTADNAAAVVAICRRLDGLPLAIELAAARVRLAPPAALLPRLERRLPLLTSGARDLPQRLRTMRDAIGWSYDLLTEEEQALFRRLAIFDGGFTLEAAEVVAGGIDVLDGVGALMDASLLRREGGPRYAMLETVREFGLELLAESGEETAARRAHADHFADLVGRAAPALRRYDSAEGLAWRDRLAADAANLRAALAWRLDQAKDRSSAEAALQMASALGWYWFFRGQSREGRHWLDRSLAADVGVTPAVRARTESTAAWLAWDLGDRPAAVVRAEAAVASFRAVGDEPGAAFALHLLGMATQDLGDLDRAEGILQEAFAAYRAVGEVAFAGQVLGDLGAGRWAMGDRAAAESLLAESLTLIRGSDEALMAVHPLTNVGGMALERGDLARAAAVLGEALALARTHGYLRGLPGCLEGTATLAVARAETATAARLLGAAEALREAIGRPMPPLDRARHERVVDTVRAQLPEPVFASAWAAGRSLPLEHALAEAESALVDTGRSQGDEPAASTKAVGLTTREADVLRLLVEGRSNPEIADALFIGRGTVRTHVSNILGKLGAATRTEAADIARRLGLV